MKENCFLDLCKFTMAMMVVAIHTGVRLPIGGYDILWPWLRIAVPLFFILSSYFFFARYDAANDKSVVLRKWLLRNGSLYLFWFLACLPITLCIRYESWIKPGIFAGLRNFCLSVLFGSTFVASWFITALVSAVMIVLVVRRYSGEIGVVGIGAAGFVWSVLSSSYGFESKGIVAYNSFPVAVIWVSIGLAFARGWNMRRGFALVMAVLSAALLWLEWAWRTNATGNGKCDCYFMLLPLAVSLFALIKDIDIDLESARSIRSLSVTIFCLHGSVAIFAKGCVIKVCGIEDGLRIFTFFVTNIVCILVWLIISRLKRQIGILKYSC